MRNFKTAIITGLVVLLVGGVFVVGVWKSRQSADRAACVNNLKQIGLALHSYHDAHKHFPTGTLANSELPPEKRFSWAIAIYPTYIEAGPVFQGNRKTAWDAEENCPPRFRFWDNGVQDFVGEGPIEAIHCFVCPVGSVEVDASRPSPLSYLGVAGIGANAGVLPLEHMHAGLFGFDRKVTYKDCKHGTATTIMIAETLDAGPWTAGGHATMRGFDPDKLPYFGVNSQFASNHAGGSNVVMADASVRFFTTTMSPRVIEAMAALAEDKNIARFDD